MAKSTSYKLQAIQKKENRATIIDAAMQVFAETGIGEATIRDIIKRSGLAAGTFYNHFKGKEEIVESILGRLIWKMEKSIVRVRRRAKTPHEYLSGSIHSLLSTFTAEPLVHQLVARNQDAIRKIRAAQSVTFFYKRNEVDLKNAMDAGLLPLVPVEYLNIVLFGIAFELLDYLKDKEDFDIKRLSDDMARLVLDGLVGLQTT